MTAASESPHGQRSELPTDGHRPPREGPPVQGSPLASMELANRLIDTKGER